MENQNLRYPIGQFIKPTNIEKSHLDSWIETIGSFPSVLHNILEAISESQLDIPYRKDGWTVRQVVHHCADSHINAFIRFKLAMTEDNPVIKPYKESLWSELEDSKYLPINSSLSIIQGIHYRWYILLKNLDADALKRKYTHPEHGKEFTLEEAIGMYSWHCQHHLAHIKSIL